MNFPFMPNPRMESLVMHHMLAFHTLPVKKHALSCYNDDMKSRETAVPLRGDRHEIHGVTEGKANHHHRTVHHCFVYIRDVWDIFLYTAEP